MASVTVEPVLFLYMMSMFIMFTTNQLFFIKKVCSTSYSEKVCANLSSNKVAEDTVQTGASHWILFFNICTNIPGAFMSMFLGATSDRIGRKFIMILPPVGTAISASVFAFTSYYIATPLGYIIIAALAVGMTGSIGAAYVTIVSYMADITDHSSRTKRFGILEAMVFIGGTVGLLCAGSLGDLEHGFTAIYLLVLLIQILIILYILCYLSESLKVEHRHGLDEKDKPVGSGCLPRRCLCFGPILDSMRRSLTVFFAKRPGNKRKYLITVQIINLLSVIGMSGEMDLLVLFSKHSPLSWDAFTIGFFMALKNILKGAVLIVVLPLLFWCIGKERAIHKDLVLAQIGAMSTLLSFVNVAFARNTRVMMMVPLVGCLSGFTGAVLGSFKTQLVEPNEFGAMFACTSFLDIFCQMAGSLLFNMLYPATLHIWPGFSFLIMAAVFVVSLIIMLYECPFLYVQQLPANLFTVEQIGVIVLGIVPLMIQAWNLAHSQDWLQCDMKKSIRWGRNVLGQKMEKMLFDKVESDSEDENTLYMTPLPEEL